MLIDMYCTDRNVGTYSSERILRTTLAFYKPALSANGSQSFASVLKFLSLEYSRGCQILRERRLALRYTPSYSYICRLVKAV